jgi:hypothetical protein
LVPLELVVELVLDVSELELVFDSVVFDSVFVDDELSLSFEELPGLEELYRSAYQPPPLRMKPAPPETWRLAVSALHAGQVLSGSALMGCSASQAWEQAVQRYS